jgi:hypothetical protein
MRPILAITIVMLLLLAGATQIPPGFAEDLFSICSPNQRPSNERWANTYLKMLAGAQGDFRANDRDGDGVNQFWRQDVSGLHFLIGRGGSKLVLIPVDLAGADDRPLGQLPGSVFRRPVHGYRFRAIRHADEDPRSLDPQRFAYVAYPANPRAGKYMYIIDENNSIRRCPAARPGGILVFPTDDELKQSWSRA